VIAPPESEAAALFHPNDPDFEGLLYTLKRHMKTESMYKWSLGVVYNLASMGHSADHILEILDLKKTMEVWL